MKYPAFTPGQGLKYPSEGQDSDLPHLSAQTKIDPTVNIAILPAARRPSRMVRPGPLVGLFGQQTTIREKAVVESMLGGAAAWPLA